MGTSKCPPAPPAAHCSSSVRGWCVGWSEKGEWPGSWASRHLCRACCTGTNKALLEGHWEHREGTDKWASKVKGKLNRRQKNTPSGGIANRKEPRPKRVGCMDIRERWVLRGESPRNILGTVMVAAAPRHRPLTSQGWQASRPGQWRLQEARVRLGNRKWSHVNQAAENVNMMTGEA